MGPVRIIVIKDTRTNQVACAAEDVIGAGLGSDGQAALSGNGGALSLPSNPKGWGRYKIIKNMVVEPPPQPAWGDNTNAGNGTGMVTTFSMKIKCNCEVNFIDGDGLVGNIIDNSFHLFGAVEEGNQASLSYYARTSFTG